MSNIIEAIRAFERPSKTTNKYDLATYEKARDITQSLIDLTNGGGKGAIVAGMVEGIVRNHRYLQQEGILCLFQALGEFGSLSEGSFTDPRNEFAHKMCKLLRERFRDELFWRDK
jgi:hypothetical protein